MKSIQSLEEFFMNSNLQSVEELREAYNKQTDEWKELKQLFIDQFYEEWSKHPQASQYAHQLTYKKILSLTDDEIYAKLMDEWSRK